MCNFVLFVIAVLIPPPALAGAYNDAGPAVIQIHVHGLYKHAIDGKADFDNIGTGFLVSPDGLVMTAGHLAPDSSLFLPDELYIDGRLPQLDHQALIAEDPTLPMTVVKATTLPHDVGLFKIQSPGRSFEYLRLCDQYTPEERLLALGYTGGQATLSRTEGTVKTPAVEPGPLVMQMPLSPGDSGAPIFNQAGGVLGIAIGGEKVNEQRIDSTSLAVLIPTAIADMSPQARALLGVSYDPDCAKKLGGATVAGTFRQFQSNPVQGLGAGQLKTVVSRFEPPTGFHFSQIVDADAKPAEGSLGKIAVEGKVQSSITQNGDAVELAIPTKSLSGATLFETSHLESRIDALLTPNQAPTEAPDGPEVQVRSFAISRTLDVHGLGTTRREFTDRVLAPEGFRFLQIVNVNIASLNHSPSKGANAAVAADGSVMTVNYALESGPFYNRWRGWIDAFVTAKIAPRDR